MLNTRPLRLTPLLLGLCCAPTASALSLFERAEVALSAGYADGLATELSVHVPRVVGPVGLRLSGSYTLANDPIKDDVDVNFGGSDETRGTFGAKKDQGQATESGRFMRFGLDGTYPLGEVFPKAELTGYIGARYGFFEVSEEYVAGAGTSGRSSSNAFGLGAGVLLNYTAFENLNLFLDLGVDHYLSSPFTDGPLQKIYEPDDANYNKRRSRYGFPSNLWKAQVGVKIVF